jgi:hypothetical protein
VRRIVEEFIYSISTRCFLTYIQLEIKPFGLEFENSRCLFTEFDPFWTKKKNLQKDTQTDGNMHRQRRSNSSLDWNFAGNGGII